jgi:hypothetical protein
MTAWLVPAASRAPITLLAAATTASVTSEAGPDAFAEAVPVLLLGMGALVLLLPAPWALVVLLLGAGALMPLLLLLGSLALSNTLAAILPGAEVVMVGLGSGVVLVEVPVGVEGAAGVSPGAAGALVPPVTSPGVQTGLWACKMGAGGAGRREGGVIGRGHGGRGQWNAHQCEAGCCHVPHVV